MNRKGECGIAVGVFREVRVFIVVIFLKLCRHVQVGLDVCKSLKGMTRREAALESR